MNDVSKMTTETVKSDERRTFMDMIESAVTNPNFSADNLEKLIAAQERVIRFEAERDFTQAMTRLKPRLPCIQKNGTIKFTDKNGVERKTPHARYEDIQRAIDPFLAEEGFSQSFDTKFTAGQPPIIELTLSHRAGHHKTISMSLQVDSSGSKNPLQAMGSTIQYGKRYLVGMMYDLVIEGRDDDAAGANEPIDTEQAAEIDLLIIKSKLSKEKVLKRFGVTDVREIAQKNYAMAVSSLKSAMYDKMTKESEK